jgi:diguanylate cyclase (GGDEF)-like protein
MLPQAQETVYLLTSVISVCFAFCILVIAVLSKSAEKSARLFAGSFFIVFIMNLFSILSGNIEISAVIIGCADALLLAVFIAVMLARASAILLLLIAAMPAAALAVLYTGSDVQTFLYRSDIIPALVILLSVALMYLLRGKKGSKSLIFWSVLALSCSGAVSMYSDAWLTLLLLPVLKLTSYIIMLYYFYIAFFRNLLTKYEASVKKLAELDRSIDFEVKKRMLEVEKVNKRLIDKARTDTLSQVMNKAAVMDEIGRLISDNRKKEFSVLMFDIDNFKHINDTYGHITGDKCIRTLAVTARSSFRSFDIVGRYGGDEFLAVLPETDAKQAMLIAERLRKKVEDISTPRFTISIGIANFPADGTDVKSLIMEADRNLYESKKSGRNTISYK